VDIEMPGIYASLENPTPESVVYLERIGSAVAIVRRHSSSVRRLAFIGSDGHTRHFSVYTNQHYGFSGARRNSCQECGSSVVGSRGLASFPQTRLPPSHASTGRLKCALPWGTICANFEGKRQLQARCQWRRVVDGRV
jgi:hypothetical protein